MKLLVFFAWFGWMSISSALLGAGAGGLGPARGLRLLVIGSLSLVAWLIATIWLAETHRW
jgi:hypothetical protein